MFPKTFHDDNFEDRRGVEDCWTWLKDQPQDTWLLWARHANWDNADLIFKRMIGDPSCDLALVSWLFWRGGADYVVTNKDSGTSGDLIDNIVNNVSAGFYRSSNLFYDRYEVVHNAHAYLFALRTQGAVPTFPLPRVLCGPFNGRRASLPARYDEDTEAGLRELFAIMDGELPRSEDEHWRIEREGGNLWIVEKFRLPEVPADPITAFAHLDDTAFLEAIFGTASDYIIARTPPKRRWWPFG